MLLKNLPRERNGLVPYVGNAGFLYGTHLVGLGQRTADLRSGTDDVAEDYTLKEIIGPTIPERKMYPKVHMADPYEQLLCDYESRTDMSYVNLVPVDISGHDRVTQDVFEVTCPRCKAEINHIVGGVLAEG